MRPSRRAGGYARAPRTARRSLRDLQRWRTAESEARPSGEGALQEAIGRQIREFRTALGMTVAELGRQSDLSPGAISKIERGLTPPSLASLSAIAGALAVPVTALFRKHEEQRDASYVEAGKGLVIERRGTRVGHRYELLGHTISGRVAIEPYLVTLTEESEVFPLFQHAGRRVPPPARGRGRLPRRRRDLPPAPGRLPALRRRRRPRPREARAPADPHAGDHLARRRGALSARSGSRPLTSGARRQGPDPDRCRVSSQETGIPVGCLTSWIRIGCRGQPLRGDARPCAESSACSPSRLRSRIAWASTSQRCCAR